MTIPTSPDGKSLGPLLAWLITQGTEGLDAVDFRVIEDRGLGCFATRDYALGDNIFRIPQCCIIGIGDASLTRTAAALRFAASELGERHSVTSELLIWVHMCEELANPLSSYSPYLTTLDKASLPDPSTWDSVHLQALSGTNLFKSCSDVNGCIAANMAFIGRARAFYSENPMIPLADTVAPSNTSSLFTLADIPSNEVVNTTTLTWARSHYLSRRYPGAFAVRAGEDTIVDAAAAAMDGREVGMEATGALVPLLDILNHSSDKNWLNLYVLNGYLHVDCNHPVKKGDELLSNYGGKPNEMLMFAYGFALDNNPDDSVTIKLMGGQEKNHSLGDEIKQGQAHDLSTDAVSKYIGTFYIGRGGVDGIPEDLWKILSTFGWDEGDEVNGNGDNVVSVGADAQGGDSDEDGFEENPISVGVEECMLLRDWLMNRLQQLDTTELFCDGIFDASADNGEGNGDGDDASSESISTSVGGACDEIHTAPRKKQRCGGANTVGSDAVVPLDAPRGGPKAQFIRHYRNGQRVILNETIEALSEIILASDEGEGGSGQEEEEEGEEDGEEGGEEDGEEGGETR